jgi:hypothetical protein
LCSKILTKGCDGINKASEARGSDISVLPGQKVHQECRRIHINPHCIEQYNHKRACAIPSAQQSHTLRSSEAPFKHFEHCLFCGQQDNSEGRIKDFKLIPVRTYDFQKNILELCAQRSDDWARKVKARIECVHDLHAADTVYHQTCSINFRTGKDIPHKFQLLSDDKSVK